MNRKQRAFPYSLTPSAEEDFDGWLLRAASAMCAFPADVMHHLEIVADRTMLAGGAFRTVHQAAIPILTAATDTNANAWRPTLEGPTTYTLRIAHLSQALRRFIGFRVGSAYCPLCLKETDGVWPWAWGAGWYLACPKHHTLMLSKCPVCDGPQGPHQVALHVTPGDPDTCQHPEGGCGTLGPATPRCGTNLTDEAPPTAPAALIALTEGLLVLTDVYADDKDVADGQELLAAFAGLAYAAIRDVRFTPEQRPGQNRTVDKLAAAAAAAQGDPEAFAAMAQARVEQRARPEPSHWQHVPLPLVEAAVKLRERRLRTYDRVRWNCYGPRISKPTRSHADVSELTQSLPSRLWPDWAMRVIPLDFEMGDQMARQHACTLITLSGWTGTTAELLGAWSRHNVTAGTTRRMLRLLTDHPDGAKSLAALTHLAHYLHTHGSPINYQERRDRLTGNIHIDRKRWIEWCEMTGTPAGTGRKKRTAEMWLTRLLTGAPPPNMAATAAAQLHKFSLTLPPGLEAALVEYARILLARSDLAREPITWSPPEDAVPAELWLTPDLHHTLQHEPSALNTRALTLMAEQGTLRQPNQPFVRSPKHVSENALRSMIIDQGLTTRTAAAKVGVNRKTISDRCHRFEIPLAKGRRRHDVDPEFLRRLYWDQQLTLQEVANQTDMSAANVARLMRDNSIPARGRGGSSHRTSRPPQHLPRELALAIAGQGGRQRIERFQHVAAARSINQAAVRLNVSQATLTTQMRMIEEAVGGALLVRNERTNRPHSLSALGERLLQQANEHLGTQDVDPLPGGILGDTLALFRGAERLQRFAVIAASSSITDAARRLGSDPSTVVRSIRALESALGVTLVEHRPRSEPLQLTPLGTELLLASIRHTTR